MAISLYIKEQACVYECVCVYSMSHNGCHTFLNINNSFNIYHITKQIVWRGSVIEELSFLPKKSSVCQQTTKQ